MSIRHITPTLRIGQRTTVTRQIQLLESGHGSAPLDLTGATGVTLTLEHYEFGFTAIEGGVCSIVDAENGIVEYTFDQADTSLHGRYSVQFEVNYGTTTELVPPSSDEWVLDIGRRQPEYQPLEVPRVTAEEGVIGDLQTDTFTTGSATINALSGPMDAATNPIRNLPDPTHIRDAIPQEYADSLFSSNNVTGASNPATADWDLNNYSAFNANEFQGNSVNVSEGHIDSFPTSLDEISGEHDNFAPTMQPRGVYHAATNRTYLASSRVDADGNRLQIECLYYDHDEQSWSDIYHVDSVTLDRHYTGVITVDADGYIYLIYDARGEPSVAKSVDPHDISRWNYMGTIPSIQDYRHVETINNVIYVWGRNGTPTNGPLTLCSSSDKGETWTAETVIDSANGMYPFGSEVVGNNYHIYTAARTGSGTAPFDYLAHLYYDTSTGTYHAADGTTLTTPIDKAGLNTAGALIDERSTEIDATIMGSAFEVTANGPRVSYLKGVEGSALDWLFARHTGTAWETTGAVDTTYTFTSQFLGSSMELAEAANGNLHLLEVMTNRTGATTSLGRYVSTDDGTTWSVREAVRDVSNLTYGLNKIQQVRGGGPIEWLAPENIDPNNSEPNTPARLFGMDGTFGDVVATQPPKRAQEHRSTLTHADDNVFDAYCRVTLGADATLTGGGSRVIPFDTIDEDQTGNFNTTTNSFTIPRSGRYQIMVSVRINNLVAGERYILAIYSGGSARSTVNRHVAPATQSFTTRRLTLTDYFNAGDELSAQLFVDSNTTVAGAGLTNSATVWEITTDPTDATHWPQNR